MIVTHRGNNFNGLLDAVLNFSCKLSKSNILLTYEWKLEYNFQMLIIFLKINMYMSIMLYTRCNQYKKRHYKWPESQISFPTVTVSRLGLRVGLAPASGARESLGITAFNGIAL